MPFTLSQENTSGPQQLKNQRLTYVLQAEQLVESTCQLEAIDSPVCPFQVVQHHITENVETVLDGLTVSSFKYGEDVADEGGRGRCVVRGRKDVADNGGGL